MTVRPAGNRVDNVPFLCTGNSARRILAKAILNERANGRFRGFSAGSHPKRTVQPSALALLERMGCAPRMRSKAWDEFATAGAPLMDFVFTVCDAAAG